MTEPTIHAALAAVMGDVRAVRKGDFNDHQKFSFRGVDAVVNAVGPALRDHGVIVFPSVRSATYEVVTTTTGKPSTACRLVVDYVFHGPAGDSITATVAAEAWDSGDKAAPKAMSVAFRTALLQALALPTDEPDPDLHTYERGHNEPSEPDPLTSAKTMVRDAWMSTHDGAWDPEAMTADYEQWSAQPIADADAVLLLDYATQMTNVADPTGITDGQVKQLSIAMSKAGLTDRDDALEWIHTTVGRRVESRKELTKAEAANAITAARELPPVEKADKT